MSEHGVKGDESLGDRLLGYAAVVSFWVWLLSMVILIGMMLCS